MMPIQIPTSSSNPPRKPRPRTKRPTRKTKPKASKHATRALQSRNWRIRDEAAFSDQSLQRQLKYLLLCADEYGKCCWHGCGVEWVVWCCGGTCRLGRGEVEGDAGREEVEDADGGEGGEGYEKRVEAREGKAQKSGLVWRDEWECDFCGAECFCWTVGDGDGGQSIRC
jgi:hypothetical protein